ncbi:hypothetical protein [Catenovulum sediminis]|uniref:Uncharacterized protein n=1 Tax=Catenovulum sediminis TaxID=1740262 RepID=A0ABV1RI87_9ALTE|nr:hypothetical protein [Catenovulum sediminis]
MIKSKMLRLALFTLSPAVFAQTNSQDESEYKLSLTGTSFSYSEVMPVIQTFGGVIPVAKIGRQTTFSTAPEEGRHALTHNRANLTFERDNFFFEVATRYDYRIDFTPDAAQLFFLDRAERPVDKDEYVLYFKAKHIRANGVGFGYQFERDKLSVRFVGHYWDVQYMEDGELDGVFLANQADDTFEVTGTLDYTYYQDAILDRKNCPKTDPPKAGCHGDWTEDGYGYSVDMLVNYHFAEDWALQLQVYDLVNQFKFDKLGRTQGQLDTRTEVFNADGTFSINPSFRGRYPDGKHKLSVSTQLNARVSGVWGIPVWAELYAANDSYFPSIGVGYQLANWRLETGYQSGTEALLFSIKHPNFKFRIGSETSDLINAQALILDLSLAYQF